MKDMAGNEMFQHFSTVFCEICLWIIVDSKIDCEQNGHNV